MARPRRSAAIGRIELRMVTDDPMLKELAQEAERRGVELQQRIYDLLRGRFLLRRGESLATHRASQAASAWAELLGSTDACTALLGPGAHQTVSLLLVRRGRPLVPLSIPDGRPPSRRSVWLRPSVAAA